MGILDFLARKPKEVVAGTKVLIVSLDAKKFEISARGDAVCYLKSYSNVNTVNIERTEELLELNQGPPDILHLFCDVTSTATIGSVLGGNLSIDRLMNKLVESNVKMLWVASENSAQSYIQGWEAARSKPLNMIFTVNRKNERYEEFLCGLLTRMASGLSVPRAWAELAPQNSNDPCNKSAPECLFVANRGQTIFQ